MNRGVKSRNLLINILFWTLTRVVPKKMRRRSCMFLTKRY